MSISDFNVTDIHFINSASIFAAKFFFRTVKIQMPKT